MNRRSFFSAAVAAPVAVAVGPALGTPCEFTRISCERGDPGERAYAILRGRNLRPKVWLDGVEQKLAVTADAKEGFVKRAVDAGGGQVAYNDVTGEVFEEIVHGRVEITVD